MKIIVTGCKGQLGNSLVTLLTTRQSALGALPGCYKYAKIYPIDVDTLDITDAEAVNSYVEKYSPDLIVNCAAFTNVDGCETNEELAKKINAYGPKNLAAAAEKIGAKFVHVSTDYIFSGDADTPYVETDEPGPRTAYGRTKLLGEKLVAENCSKHFILRTAWLYGYIGKNFVKTVRRLGKELGHIDMVNDQRGNPTNADDLSYHILAVAATDNYGIYHCTGSGECTWYDFACEILKLSNIECDIKPCTTDENARPAHRPAYSSLRNLHLEQTIGDKMRDWKVALKEYIENLEKMESNNK